MMGCCAPTANLESPALLLLHRGACLPRPPLLTHAFSLSLSRMQSQQKSKSAQSFKAFSTSGKIRSKPGSPGNADFLSKLNSSLEMRQHELLQENGELRQMLIAMRDEIKEVKEDQAVLRGYIAKSRKGKVLEGDVGGDETDFSDGHFHLPLDYISNEISSTLHSKLLALKEEVNRVMRQERRMELERRPEEGTSAIQAKLIEGYKDKIRNLNALIQKQDDVIRGIVFCERAALSGIQGDNLEEREDLLVERERLCEERKQMEREWDIASEEWIQSAFAGTLHTGTPTKKKTKKHRRTSSIGSVGSCGSISLTSPLKSFNAGLAKLE